LQRGASALPARSGTVRTTGLAACDLKTIRKVAGRCVPKSWRVSSGGGAGQPTRRCGSSRRRCAQARKATDVAQPYQVSRSLLFAWRMARTSQLGIHDRMPLVRAEIHGASQSSGFQKAAVVMRARRSLAATILTNHVPVVGPEKGRKNTGVRRLGNHPLH
jgi:hypothetical protein